MIRLLPILLIGLALYGCEEPVRYEVMDPPPVTAPEEAVAPAAPTAEEVARGPWQSLRLGPLPLTAEVPLGWEITRLGEVVLFGGPMPSGEVQIQLASRSPMSQAQLELLLEGAQQEREQDAAVVHVELREQHGMRVLEKRSVAELSPPMGDAGGEAAGAAGVNVMNWRVNVLVPMAQQMFENHELNFVALELEQFEADRELLERMVRSIRRE
jgi:hypothetical protein